MTSPTTRAHFTNGRSGRRFASCIAQRMRRWTGLSPSRTSGSARCTMTLIAYSRNAPSTSSCSVRVGISDGGSSVSWLGVRRRAIAFLLHVEEPGILGVALDPVAARVDVVTHQDRQHVVGDRGLVDVDL